MLFRSEAVGEVLVLHGEVSGALEALDAGVDHLPRQPPERRLDFQIEVRPVQIVVPQALNHHKNTHASDSDRPFRAETRIDYETTKNRIRELPYFLRREETVSMWMRASGLRRGLTNHCENADSIDDIVGGGAAAAAAIPFVSSLPRCCVGERRGGVVGVVVSLLGRLRKPEVREMGRDKGRAYLVRSVVQCWE